mmetsp:Transcript_29899/g.65354  ORF Transcript_29899/g.65354 Transcript_29899/m.65354 type:complete len:645 (-) Transcript_29899:900-2834(-)
MRTEVLRDVLVPVLARLQQRGHAAGVLDVGVDGGDGGAVLLGLQQEPHHLQVAEHHRQVEGRAPAVVRQVGPHARVRQDRAQQQVVALGGEEAHARAELLVLLVDLQRHRRQQVAVELVALLQLQDVRRKLGLLRVPHQFHDILLGELVEDVVVAAVVQGAVVVRGVGLGGAVVGVERGGGAARLRVLLAGHLLLSGGQAEAEGLVQGGGKPVREGPHVVRLHLRVGDGVAGGGGHPLLLLQREGLEGVGGGVLVVGGLAPRGEVAVAVALEARAPAAVLVVQLLRLLQRRAVPHGRSRHRFVQVVENVLLTAPLRHAVHLCELQEALGRNEEQPAEGLRHYAARHGDLAADALLPEHHAAVEVAEEGAGVLQVDGAAPLQDEVDVVGHLLLRDDRRVRKVELDLHHRRQLVDEGGGALLEEVAVLHVLAVEVLQDLRAHERRAVLERVVLVLRRLVRHLQMHQRHRLEVLGDGLPLEKVRHARHHRAVVRGHLVALGDNEGNVTQQVGGDAHVHNHQANRIDLLVLADGVDVPVADGGDGGEGPVGGGDVLLQRGLAPQVLDVREVVPMRPRLGREVDLLRDEEEPARLPVRRHDHQRQELAEGDDVVVVREVLLEPLQQREEAGQADETQQTREGEGVGCHV